MPSSVWFSDTRLPKIQAPIIPWGHQVTTDHAPIRLYLSSLLKQQYERNLLSQDPLDGEVSPSTKMLWLVPLHSLYAATLPSMGYALKPSPLSLTKLMACVPI